MSSQRVPIERFPPEVLCLVFDELEYVEALICAMVGRRWRCLLGSEDIEDNVDPSLELIIYASDYDNAKMIYLIDPKCVGVRAKVVNILICVAEAGAAKCMKTLREIGVDPSYARLERALEVVKKETCEYVILKWMKAAEDKEDKDIKNCDQRKCIPKIEKKLRPEDLTRDELILRVKELEAGICSACQDVKFNSCKYCKLKFCSDCIYNHYYQERQTRIPTFLDIVNIVVIILKKKSILVKNTSKVYEVIRECIYDKGWIKTPVSELGMKFGDYPCNYQHCWYNEDRSCYKEDRYNQSELEAVYAFDIRGLEGEHEAYLQFCSVCFDNVFAGDENITVPIIYVRVANHFRLEQLSLLAKLS